VFAFETTDKQQTDGRRTPRPLIHFDPEYT
jgi:hypothetical protein